MKPYIGGEKKSATRSSSPRRRNFRYSSRTAASLRAARLPEITPGLYRNRIYIRPSLSVRRPQRTPQRGTVVNNEYASVFVYSGSTQRCPLPSLPTPTPLRLLLLLPRLRRPTPPPFSSNGGELQHARSSLLFTTPQLANPKASILHT